MVVGGCVRIYVLAPLSESTFFCNFSFFCNFYIGIPPNKPRKKGKKALGCFKKSAFVCVSGRTYTRVCAHVCVCVCMSRSGQNCGGCFL
jgi:hypothetical protein